MVVALVARGRDTVALEDLPLREPGPGDVRVRIEASGLCHSDVSLVDGTLPGKFPVVLGHEGAGTIEEVGDAVEHLAEGQRVVLSAMPACGDCWHCDRAEPYLCERSADIRRPAFGDGTVRGASGLGTFSDAVVVDQRAVVPIDTDLPADQLSVIGCAVLTGVGSALNTAGIQRGESVVVMGAGGVGLAAIQGARYAGGAPIVAVDPSPTARAAAVACGATHAVAPYDASDVVADLVGPRGVDAVLECVGFTATFRAAWEMTRRGGRVVMVGAPPVDQLADVPLVEITLSGRAIVGSVFGQSDGQADIQGYIDLAQAGHLDFAALIGRRVAMDEMPDAVAEPVEGPGRVVMIAVDS